MLYKNTFDDEDDNNITKVEVIFEDASIVEDIQQESNNKVTFILSTYKKNKGSSSATL